MPELLAPAGSPKSVKAAVYCGASAVYIGLNNYNARRNAKNFTTDEMHDAVSFCHKYGVRVYVTLNTLLTDREISDAETDVRLINASGADGVLIQDLGVAKLVKMTAPDLPIHASTQMTIMSLDGVKAARDAGFSRVVLARELPFSEIEYIARNSPIETEVFVHGALCVSYSGQCYMSSLIGGRSGNRGLCGGPCRLPYYFFGEAEGYPLSLKDLCLSGYLKRLADAGVTAFKIEGRMKRPEYVAAVTAAYSAALREGRELTSAEQSRLASVFSREGFTDGYIAGKKGPHMFGVRSEASVREAKDIYADIQKTYSEQDAAPPPLLPVDFSFVAVKNRKVLLSGQSGNDASCVIERPPAEPAHTRETSEFDVKSALSKTGGTLFFPRDIKTHVDPGLNIPLSLINAMRRECLDQLSASLTRRPRRRTGEFHPGFRRLNQKEPPVLTVSVARFEQLSAELVDEKPAKLYIPLTEAAKNLNALSDFVESGVPISVILPRVIFDSELKDMVGLLKPVHMLGISDVLCGNIGLLRLARELGLTVSGDYGLNIFNSQSLKEYKALGLSSATLSFELNFSQIRDISKSLPVEILAYGRLPLMTLENCLSKDRNMSCACFSSRKLVDRTGKIFTLMPEYGCRNTLYNPDKLYLADKKRDYENIGVWGARLSFTTENPKECVDVIKSYKGQKPYVPSMITRGLYYRRAE